MNDLEAQKSLLRKQIRASLAGMAETDRVTANHRLRDRLKEQAAWQRARAVLFFAPIAGEPDIWPLLEETVQAGKLAALPHFSEATGAYIVRRIKDVRKDVRNGRYGISEPDSSCDEVALNGLDLALVPGIGFDVNGRRLGRGKGHYDRLLAGMGGQKCGVAFDVQIVDEIPTGPHDIRVNCILTPTRWMET
jgi:5-formyltetrahydrofolate cyclo-ligase